MYIRNWNLMWHCGGCDGCVAHRPVWDALLVSRSAAVLPPLSRVTVRTRPIPDVDLWSGHVSISDVTRIHLHESARTPRYQGDLGIFEKNVLFFVSPIDVLLLILLWIPSNAMNSGSLKPQSNGPLYSTVTGTLAVDWWAVIWPHPVPSSLYQM